MHLFQCPNSGFINIAYVEFVSPVSLIEPTEENKLEVPVYAFFVRTMSGFSVGFEEQSEELINSIRDDLVSLIKTS